MLSRVSYCGINPVADIHVLSSNGGNKPGRSIWSSRRCEFVHFICSTERASYCGINPVESIHNMDNMNSIYIYMLSGNGGNKLGRSIWPSRRNAFAL